MKTLLKIALPVLVLALGFAVRTWLIEHAPAPPPGAPSAAIPLVEVRTVRLAAQRLWVTAHGVLRPERELALAAETSGRVVWIAEGLAEGAAFAAGEELLRLDPTDATQALAAAEAERARAEAALAIEQAAAASARADWEAFGTGEPTPLALREPQVALATAALAAAASRVAQAETMLERCSVRAPFAGRCVQRLAVPGAVVAPGTPLARLHSSEGFEARVALSAADLRTLDLGAAFASREATIEAAGTDGPAWRARLVRLEPALDPRDRTASAILVLDDPTPLPLAGAFVRARILGPELQGVANMPRAARQADARVWRVDDSGRLRLTAAEVAAEVDEGLLLRGLADGDRICLTPLAIAVEGMPVQAREAP